MDDSNSDLLPNVPETDQGPLVPETDQGLLVPETDQGLLVPETDQDPLVPETFYTKSSFWIPASIILVLMIGLIILLVFFLKKSNDDNTTCDPVCGYGKYCKNGQCVDCACTASDHMDGTCDPYTGTCKCGAFPACRQPFPLCKNHKCVFNPQDCDPSCTSGEQCDPKTGICVCGLSGNACDSSTPNCVNGVCYRSKTDCDPACDSQNSDRCDPRSGTCLCGLGPACDGNTPNCINGNCVPTRKSCSPCDPTSTDRCDPLTGHCVCGLGPACDGDTPNCIKGACVQDPVDCDPACGPPHSNVCDKRSGNCLCGKNPECSGDTPLCINSVCYQSEDDCFGNCDPDTSNSCNPGTGQCNCGLSKACSGGQTCVNGECVEKCDPACTGNTYCFDGQSCQDCECDGQPSTDGTCDPNNGLCKCGDTYFCQTSEKPVCFSGSCVECMDDDQCIAGLCDSHVCVPCTSTDRSLCQGENQYCQDNKCVDCPCDSLGYSDGSCDEKGNCMCGQNQCEHDDVCKNGECIPITCDPSTGLSYEVTGLGMLNVTWTWPETNDSSVNSTLQLVDKMSGCTGPLQTVNGADEQATYTYTSDDMATGSYDLHMTVADGVCSSPQVTIASQNDKSFAQQCTNAQDCTGYTPDSTICFDPGSGRYQCEYVSCE